MQSLTPTGTSSAGWYLPTCDPSQGQVKYHLVGACHMMAVGAYLIFRGFAHLIQQATDRSFVIDVVTLCVWLGPALRI